MIFIHLVNDIKYFQDIHLVTEEEVAKLKDELFHLLDELEELQLSESIRKAERA